MPILRGEVGTDRADRYLSQLVSHTKHMVTLGPTTHGGDSVQRVESTGSGAIVYTGQGRCILDTTTQGLTITVEAADTDRLHQLQRMITSRLETIGRRDKLMIQWDQPPPQSVAKRRTTLLLAAAVVLAVAIHVAIGAAMLRAPQWTSFLADGLVVILLVKVALVVLGHRLIRHRRHRVR